MQNKNRVKDKQACISREKGYALITTMFLMVSFLSLAFVLFHPLAREVQNDSGFHMVDRNNYRFRKALFGETVDQCGTKLVHCGGLYSDYFTIGKVGTQAYRYQRQIWARTYGTSVFGPFSETTVKGNVKIPTPYHFNEDHFWTGYLGKRYLYVLPSDNWKYDTYFGRSIYMRSEYRPFYQDYADHKLATTCNDNSITYVNYADFALVKSLHQSNGYTSPREIRIVLYDYSKGRDNHTFRLVMTGSANTRAHMYFTHVDSTTGSTNSYKRLVYWQDEYDNMTSIHNRLPKQTGQRKLLIQVRENSGDTWVTRDTRVICPSARDSANAGYTKIFWVNFYG